MKRNIALIAIISMGMSQLATAQLFGVAHGTTNDTFYSINSTTGAATEIFSFSNGGGVFIRSLTYNPVTNKFLTVRNISNSQRRLVEIDPVNLTATVVTTQIPTTMFEAVEYSTKEGGLIVSYGDAVGVATNRLALLDNNYNLIKQQTIGGMSDMDNIFVDEAGDINKMDASNFSGNMRQRINNPFTPGNTLTNIGTNIFTLNSDSDFAYSQANSTMFMTELTNLKIVNTASTQLTTVGSYGLDGNGQPIVIRGIAAMSPVPEPTTMTVCALGLFACLRKKLKTKVQ